MIEEQPQSLAARAFEPGILGHDLARLVARQRRARSPCADKIGEAIVRQAGLLRAEHLALAAQAQIFLGDPKPVFASRA